jgi:ferrous iron transport protein A
MMVQKIPLSLVSAGTEARITDIHAGEAMSRRLTAMGLSPESRVIVVCTDRGSLIISVAGARYALSKGMAMKILVTDPVPVDIPQAGA